MRIAIGKAKQCIYKLIKLSSVLSAVMVMIMMNQEKIYSFKWFIEQEKK